MVGTVTVRAGSRTIQGTATAFVASRGDTFVLEGLSLPIESRTSGALLTAQIPWPADDVEDATDWVILPTSPRRGSIVEVNQNLVEIVRRIDAGLPSGAQTEWRVNGTSLEFRAVGLGGAWTPVTDLATTARALSDQMTAMLTQMRVYLAAVTVYLWDFSLDSAADAANDFNNDVGAVADADWSA